MKTLKIHIKEGEEILQKLNGEFEHIKLLNGSIVSVIGAVEGCCISNMEINDAQKDILTEYHEPMEISGNGEIRDGKAHIHCTLSKEGDIAIHGHLHWAHVKTWYVHVFILH